MKRRVKSFCLRGIAFGGFGPIVYALVMMLLYFSNVDTTINGLDLFKGIISTYLLGFICSGVSIVWKEEKLGIGYAILIHGFSIYVSYLIVYLLNNWIPKEPIFVLIFTAIFVLVYILILLIVYLIERHRVKKLNDYLK